MHRCLGRDEAVRPHNSNHLQAKMPTICIPDCTSEPILALKSDVPESNIRHRRSDTHADVFLWKGTNLQVILRCGAWRRKTFPFLAISMPSDT